MEKRYYDLICPECKSIKIISKETQKQQCTKPANIWVFQCEDCSNEFKIEDHVNYIRSINE